MYLRGKTYKRDMSIRNHFVKVLFPFQYSGRASECLEKVLVVNQKGKEIPIFERFYFDNAGLRRGVADLFSSNDSNLRILECFRITYNSRPFFKLPRKKTDKLHFFSRERGAEQFFEIAIEEICLYLFETGIGFVELEVSYASTDIKDYMDCNYFLCEVKTEKNYLVSQIKKWNATEKKEEITDETFTVKELLADVLEYLPGVTDFYTGNAWNKTIEKGLLYSYLYLDSKPENLQSTLFNLRNNYKQSYKAPDIYEKVSEDSHILQLFQNSYWCASYNATVNVSIETNDFQTNDFFDNLFFSSMRSSYYVLFLSVLHQRYLMIKLQSELDKMDRFASGFDMMKKQLNWAQEFQTEATKHRLRAFFKQPSCTEHVNMFFKFLGEVYYVDELYISLTTDLDNLARICSVYVDRIQAREDLERKYRSAKIEIFVGVFGTIVGAISLFNDSWQFLERFFGNGIESHIVLVILVTVFLLLPSMLVIYNSIKNIREMKKIKNEIGEEVGQTKINKRTFFSRFKRKGRKYENY